MSEKENKAITIKLKAGEKLSICTCGKSKNIPFCDNEHRKVNEENGTNYKPLKIMPKQDTEIMVYSSNWEDKQD